MTDKTNSNSPQFYAFTVRETEEKSFFTRIGAAFAHAKGGGLTIDLDAHPIDRKLVLFPPKGEDMEEPSTP